MSKATPARVARELREAQAIELRRSGATYEQIATALGLANKGAAYKIVKRVLEHARESAAEDANFLRDLHNRRIENAIFRISGSVNNGNLTAVDKLCRLLERQAKMNGLDAPTRLAPVLPPGMAQPQDPNAPPGQELPEGAYVSGLIAIVPARLPSVESWAAQYSPTKTTEPSPEA